MFANTLYVQVCFAVKIIRSSQGQCIKHEYMSIFDSFCDASLAGVELAVVAPRLHIVRALVDRGDVPLPCLEVNNFLIVGEGDVPVVVVLVQADVDGGLLSRDPGVGLVNPVAQLTYM